jgi:hypothetical protein
MARRFIRVFARNRRRLTFVRVTLILTHALFMSSGKGRPMNGSVGAVAPLQKISASDTAEDWRGDDADQPILRRGYNCPGCGEPKLPEDDWCLRCLAAPPSLTC